MARPDDEDDFYDSPAPKKSGGGGLLVLGIVLGAAVLLVLLVLVCGGAFVLPRVGPEPPPRTAVDKASADKPAPVKDREHDAMKARNGPPPEPDK